MRVLVINNRRATKDNPKWGSYVTTIGKAIQAAGNQVDYLLPRKMGASGFGKVHAYMLFYWDVLRRDLAEYDLIYVNHYPYVALPLLLRLTTCRRLAVHWHGEDLLPPSKIKAGLFVPLIKLLPIKTYHFVPSVYFSRVLLERKPDATVAVTPSGGVDMDKFCLPQRSSMKNVVRIGFASGLDNEKGLDLLKLMLENLGQLESDSGRKVEVHYIDYGPEKGTLINLEQCLAGRLIRHPPKKHDEMVKFYHSIDILLFPTRRKAESLGLVPLEAMACGVPVLATNDFACSEYVLPSVSGELYDPLNQEEMMDKLIISIGRLGQYQPRKVVELEYSFQRVVHQYEQILPGIEEI